MKKHCILFVLIFLIMGLQAQRFHTGARSLVFTDTERDNRTVHAQVFFPVDSTGQLGQGDFPVIFFAHGQEMSFAEYDYLWHNLVGNGYIMIFPTTEQGPAFDVLAMSEDILAIWKWIHEDTAANFYREVLSDNFGLVGHGLGGSAAILAASTQPKGLRSLVTLSAIESEPSAIQAAAKLQVPYLSIGTDSKCLAAAEEHQLPILNAAGSGYKAWMQIKRGTFCQFGRAYEGSPCRNRESLDCSIAVTTISRTQQQTIGLLAAFPWMEFLLRAKCDFWEHFHSFARNPSTHTFQEWGVQPNPKAEFSLEQIGSVIWLKNHSRSAISYLWDFGDGKSTIDPEPTHIYQKVNPYTITLKIQAFNGCSDSVSKNIDGLSAVKLLGFRAKSEDKTIILDWATATESQNAFFVVERSINGIDFHDYARVPGEISSFARKNYLFEDASMPSGIYFYRLRQETTYGSQSFSELVQVKHRLSISLAITDFSISMAESTLKLGFHCENEGATAIRLLNLAGTTIFSKKIEAIPGRNTTSFLIPHFQRGIYILTATQNDETAHRTIFIR